MERTGTLDVAILPQIRGRAGTIKATHVVSATAAVVARNRSTCVLGIHDSYSSCYAGGKTSAVCDTEHKRGGSKHIHVDDTGRGNGSG